MPYFDSIKHITTGVNIIASYAYKAVIALPPAIPDYRRVARKQRHLLFHAINGHYHLADAE